MMGAAGDQHYVAPVVSYTAQGMGHPEWQQQAIQVRSICDIDIIALLTYR